MKALIRKFSFYLQNLPQWSCIRLQKSFEFVKFNFSRSILIDFLNKFLNIYSHLELLFDSLNQFACINTSTTIGLSSHSNIGIKQFGFVTLNTSCNFPGNYSLLKWRILNSTLVLGVDVWNDLIHFLIVHLDVHVVKYLPYLIDLDFSTTSFLIKSLEGLVAFIFNFSCYVFFGKFGFILRSTVAHL